CTADPAYGGSGLNAVTAGVIAEDIAYSLPDSSNW
ncbi:unnamed protein product, partial [marine sediment metagenome]